jgi:hypothetical protein
MFGDKLDPNHNFVLERGHKAEFRDNAGTVATCHDAKNLTHDFVHTSRNMTKNVTMIDNLGSM